TYSVNGGEITDSITGLTWQKVATPSLEWGAAVSHCSGLGGGWRLPTRLELISLLDYGSNDATNGYLPLAFTASPSNASYWASTASFNDSKNAWFVSVESGGTSPHWAKAGVISKLSVRCVKGGTLSAAPFVENQSCDIVSSPSTGLMWQRTPDSALRIWSDALSYCEDLKHAGYDDWRLPNEKELSTIVDDQRAGPTIDPAFNQTSQEAFWSSTPNRKKSDEARFVYFFDGSHYVALTVSYEMAVFKLRARCVRNL
ncbi:MAG TPA: DUF1566 domain-containing protein, partial [Polyangiaceae bacterium]|nr:DUF1566 domain-containing protein [Polyangiaceae bacterium]